MFYSSPQNFSAFDDIEYLLDFHVSSVIKDNSILKFERGGSFSLRSFSDYFALNRTGNSAGPYMQDFFAYEDNTSKSATTSAPIFALDQLTPAIKFSFPEFNLNPFFVSFIKVIFKPFLFHIVIWFLINLRIILIRSRIYLVLSQV